MGLKYYITTMILATILCWVAWFLVIFNIDPRAAGVWSFILFYLSLFLSLAGSFSVTGFVFRVFFLKNKEPYFRLVKRSFRHSLFFALLLIVALFLQSLRLLNWWNLIILILAFSFFEMSFLTERKTV